MICEQLLVRLVSAPGEAVESAGYQRELRELENSLSSQGLQPSFSLSRMHAAAGESAAIYSGVLLLTTISSVAVPCIVAWIKGRSGRKVRLEIGKSGSVKAEAQNVREVEKLVKIASEYQRNPAKSLQKKSRKRNPNGRLGSSSLPPHDRPHLPTGHGVTGTQPIRVLDHNVLEWFESKYSGFRSELEDLGKQFGFSRHINYICGEVPIFGIEGEDLIPYVTVDTGQIAIHETFLSYIWGLSYAFLVLFDEEINGPKTGKQPGHGRPLGFFRPKGYAMLDYTRSLVRGFNKWPAGLPNPESYNKEDEYYVLKANGIYLAAVDFILCHELAHIALGHLQKQEQAVNGRQGLSSREIKKLENAADKWAIDRILKGVRSPDRTLTTVGFGAIGGLGSLLLLNPNLTSQTHPDINDRIRGVLTGLPISPRDGLWGIAAAFYFVWNHQFDGGLDFSHNYTYCALVEAIDRQLYPKKQLELKRREEQRAKGLGWSLD